MTGKLPDTAKCITNKQLNYKDILQCFNYFAASRGKVTVRESQQTRGSSLLPCLSFHERSAECVCLCLMFTVPNKRVAKNFLLTGHNLQWRGPKVKMALLCSYCTYSVCYKTSPLATSVPPPCNKRSKNKTHTIKKEEVDFGSRLLI